MNLLQTFLAWADEHPHDPECPDDMTRAFTPVRGNYYGPHNGQIGVSWFNTDRALLKETDGETTQHYDEAAFWDAIEHLGLLRVESVNRNGGVISVKGSETQNLHEVVGSIRELVDFFAHEDARPVR